MINLDSKIYIAGHNGMVGSAILKKLKAQGFANLITSERRDLNLLNQAQVQDFLQCEQPDAIVVAAAKVGGIHANSHYPADFIYENLMLECNLVHGAYVAGVMNLLFLGSSCIYPKGIPQPMVEESLLTQTLEPTNEPYAIAKIAGIKLCESYNRQYGTDYRSVMPTNLYGPNDNFNLENSHVIPATIRKFHDAKVNGSPSVQIWGDGSPKREFLHVGDMADACIHVMKLSKDKVQSVTSPMTSHINIGSGNDISIAEMALLVKDIVGFQGEVEFDTTKPNGIQRKLLNVSKVNELGWRANISLAEGLRDTYAWFLENQSQVRR